MENDSLKKFRYILVGVVLILVLVKVPIAPCVSPEDSFGIAPWCTISEHLRNFYLIKLRIIENLNFEKQMVGRNNKTFNWTTYRNEEYGFEISYPISAKLFGDFSKDGSVSIFEQEISEGTGLNIKYSTKTSDQLVDEMSENYEIISNKEAVFNGLNAREIIRKSEVGGPYRVILISRNSGAFVLTHWIGQYEDTLSTFKFTK